MKIYKTPRYVTTKEPNVLGRWQVLVRNGVLDSHSNHSTEEEADVVAAQLNLKEAMDRAERTRP